MTPEMAYSPLILASFIGFILLLLVLDLGLLHRKERVIKMKEALLMSLGYFLLAMAFADGVNRNLGADKAYEFLTGYLVELSLSVDNLFVFVLIFTHFMVPQKLQHRVLFWGILGALVMRGLFIYLGTELVQQFEWLMYVFGAFLIFTAVKMLFSADAQPDMENNRIVRFLHRHAPITKDFHGKKFFVRENGKLFFTPLFVVLVLVELSDVIFAVDSIPAIFAITQDPLIIYTSNVFAILGLRSLYFAIAHIVYRFEYLKYGLSLVLMLIGVKMVVNEYMGFKFIPTEIALGITATLIFGSIIVSWIKTRGQPSVPRDEMTGWVPGSDAKEDKK